MLWRIRIPWQLLMTNHRNTNRHSHNSAVVAPSTLSGKKRKAPSAKRRTKQATSMIEGSVLSAPSSQDLNPSSLFLPINTRVLH